MIKVIFLYQFHISLPNDSANKLMPDNNENSKMTHKGLVKSQLDENYIRIILCHFCKIHIYVFIYVWCKKCETTFTHFPQQPYKLLH